MEGEAVEEGEGADHGAKSQGFFPKDGLAKRGHGHPPLAALAGLEHPEENDENIDTSAHAECEDEGA
jgi:hypothetical protein